MILVSRIRSALAILTLLSALFAGSVAGAQSIQTGKDVYAPREPIDLTFGGATGSRRDYVTLAPAGAPENHNTNGQYLQGQISGNAVLKPLSKPGAYEVRLISGETGKVLSAYPFVIGAFPAQQAAQRPASQQPGTAAPARDAGGTTQVRTLKQVYQPGETITVRFSDAPAVRRDYIAIAPVGAAETTKYNGVYLNGLTDGSVDLRPWQPGVLEARLYDGQTGEIAARHIFSIGETCLDDAIAATTVCPPSVRTEKDEYAAGEPITILYEGAAGGHRDWVGIVEKTGDGSYRSPPGGSKRFGAFSAPDGERKPFFGLARSLKGSTTLAGLDAGTYEVRLHFQGAPVDQPAARHEFVVGDFESDVKLAVLSVHDGGAAPDGEAAWESFTASLPEPGLEGSWLGYLTCVLRKTARGAVTDTTSVLLEIAGNSQPSAEMFVLWRGRDGTATRLAGNYDLASNSVFLGPTEWIYQPRAAGAPLGLELTLDASGVRMHGKVSGDVACTDIQAVKYRRDDRPDYDQGMLTALKTYGDTLLTEELCVAYLSWMENAGTVKTMGVEVPSQVLDADTFYRVVGKPFDRWTQDDHRSLQAFWNRCISQFRGHANIALSSLIERSLSDRPLWYFMNAGIPTATRPNPREHFRYLDQYAALVALRNARLYADLQAEEAGKLPDSRENLRLLAKEIERVGSGEAVFVALPEDERAERARALTARKHAMSGVLVDQAFAAYDISAYPMNLDGLKRAWAARAPIEREAAEYATPEQVAELNRRFTETFTPHSAAVRDHALVEMPAIESSLAGIVGGKAQKNGVEAAVAAHLLPPDSDRLLAAYEERNVAALEGLLPTLSAALSEEIPPDEAGKAQLEEMSQLLLGGAIAELSEKRFRSPYGQLALAFVDHAETLKFQICDLPAGFEELLATICPEAVEVARARDGG